MAQPTDIGTYLSRYNIPASALSQTTRERINQVLIAAGGSAWNQVLVILNQEMAKRQPGSGSNTNTGGNAPTDVAKDTDKSVNDALDAAEKKAKRNKTLLLVGGALLVVAGGVVWAVIWFKKHRKPQ